MNVHPRSVRLEALLVAAIVLGCSTTAPTAVPATSAPTQTPEPSFPDLGISNGVLDAGRYRLRGFEPPITVGLDGTWSSLAQMDGYAALENTPGMPGLLVQVGLVDSLGERDLVATPTTAEEATGLVQSIQGVNVIETAAASIGGLDGTEVTLERPGEMTIGSVLLLLDVPGGGIGLTPGTRIRIVFFDSPQGLVAIMVRGTIEDWPRDVMIAQPVVDHIQFEQVRFEVPSSAP